MQLPIVKAKVKSIKICRLHDTCYFFAKMKTFTLNNCIHGYHVYKDVWTPSVGKTVELQTLRQKPRRSLRGCSAKGWLDYCWQRPSYHLCCNTILCCIFPNNSLFFSINFEVFFSAPSTITFADTRCFWQFLIHRIDHWLWHTIWQRAWSGALKIPSYILRSHEATLPVKSMKTLDMWSTKI